MAASADFAESAGPHCAVSKATCDQGGRHPADSASASPPPPPPASASISVISTHHWPGTTLRHDSPRRLHTHTADYTAKQACT